MPVRAGMHRSLLSFILLNTHLHSQLMLHWKRSRGINQKVLRDMSGKEQITAMVWECYSWHCHSWSLAACPLPTDPCCCIGASPALLAAQASVWLQNSPPPPRAWLVTRFYSVLVTVQELVEDKNRLVNVHLKASALLLKIWCYVWNWLTGRAKTSCSS